MAETGYAPMTREELAGYRVASHGRDYSRSCSGDEDMELAAKHGWTVISCWGHDGWNLGDWPYVSIMVRRGGDRIYQVQQIVEGDHDIWAFPDKATLVRAVDYLFLWYAAGRDWAPLGYDDREALDRGELTVDDKWRGECQV